MNRASFINKNGKNTAKMYESQIIYSLYIKEKYSFNSPIVI